MNFSDRPKPPFPREWVDKHPKIKNALLYKFWLLERAVFKFKVAIFKGLSFKRKK